MKWIKIRRKSSEIQNSAKKDGSLFWTPTKEQVLGRNRKTKNCCSGFTKRKGKKSGQKSGKTFPAVQKTQWKIDTTYSSKNKSKQPIQNKSMNFSLFYWLWKLWESKRSQKNMLKKTRFPNLSSLSQRTKMSSWNHKTSRSLEYHWILQRSGIPLRTFEWSLRTYCCWRSWQKNTFQHFILQYTLTIRFIYWTRKK